VQEFAQGRRALLGSAVAATLAATAGGRQAGAADSGLSRLRETPAGRPLPDNATFTDIEGVPTDLADLRGQVVVVNFWATWCPPCRAELPEFQKYQALAPEGLKVVGIDLLASETGGLEAVKAFVEDKQMAWTQWVDDRGRLAEAFGVTSIPTTIVLDPQGRVVDRRVGAVDLPWLKGLEGRFLGR